MLAKYNIDPEKFEVVEIDKRKDMDEIQAYMKKVTVKCFQNWKRILCCDRHLEVQVKQVTGSDALAIPLV